MQRKVECGAMVILAVLLLSIVISSFQASYGAPQAGVNSAATQSNGSLQLNYGGFSVTEHKMTASELQSYESAVGVYQPAHNYNQVVNGHGTGLRPPTASEWTDIANNGYVVDSVRYQAPLPTVVDLSQTPWFPPIGDQGHQGSCAFFADVYYAKTYQEAKENQWNLSQATWVGDERSTHTGSNNGQVAAAYQSEVMSPSFVYHLINNGTDMGGSMEGPIMVMDSIGVSSWQNMPYDQNNVASWPSEAAWAQAPYYRSNSTYGYQYIYVNATNGVNNLKSWLAAGNVATFAIDAVDNIDPIAANNSQDLFTLDNWVFGTLDHAQTIVGYNDSITYMENGKLHSGVFKIVNSWGTGTNWENRPDGYYWMSYKVMAELSAMGGDPVVLSQSLADYQPQILATFNISHAARSDCNITFGVGNPSAPIVTKTFDEFYQGDLFTGGALPFPANNIVFDLTEFKDKMASMYNQPFFMQVHDMGPDEGGTKDTGVVNYFAIGNISCSQTPVATIKDQTVTLTLNYSLAPTTLTVSPTAGPPSGAITLSGVGFAGSSVNISYLNPVNSTWIPVTSNPVISENFSYATHAPDLLQNSPSGDNPPSFDHIVFRAQNNGNGNSYNTTVPYMEWRRGLIQVGNETATGLYGNATDFATTIFVKNGQPLIVAGNWFCPGTATVFWDNTGLSTAAINQTGFFNTTVTVPATTAGQHTLTVGDGATNVSVTLTRLPTVANGYSDYWHTADFSINLTSDYSGIQTYYRINNGTVETVSADGQPLITSEGGNNTLEYWSTWDVYGTGNMSLTHVILTGIKLDKTAPQASMQINGGATFTSSSTVTLTLTATDSVSGVSQMRFSNDGTWSQATWEPYANSKTWQLTSGDGAKTVYCQIQDNAGLTTTLSNWIILSTQQSSSSSSTSQSSSTSPTTTPSPSSSPTALTSPEPSATPQVPEFSIQMILVLLALATLAIAVHTRRNVKFKKPYLR